MRKLRQEMEKARLILETMIKREKEKRALVDVLQEITDLNLQTTKTNAAPKSKTQKKAKKGRSKKSTKRYDDLKLFHFY